MSALTKAQLERFRHDGYLAPLPGLSRERARVLRLAVIEHLTGATEAECYELTDEVQVRDAGDGTAAPTYEYVDEPLEPELRELPFLFNVWKVDERFARVAHDTLLVSYAQALLDTDEVLLMEDNVVVKRAGAKAVPWHQDYSYWPLGEPRAVTVWIALDDIGPANGAMEVASGTQHEGERLPVRFKDGSAFMATERPGVPEVPADPRALGYPVRGYELRAGECGIHDALVWHGSTPNRSDRMRCALVLRYVAAGTRWLGSARIPYEDVGCAVGAPLAAAHFPLAGAPSAERHVAGDSRSC